MLGPNMAVWFLVHQEHHEVSRSLNLYSMSHVTGALGSPFWEKNLNGLLGPIRHLHYKSMVNTNGRVSITNLVLKQLVPMVLWGCLAWGCFMNIQSTFMSLSRMISWSFHWCIIVCYHKFKGIPKLIKVKAPLEVLILKNRKTSWGWAVPS